MTTNTPPEPHRRGLIARIRGNFLAGLIIIAPIGLTLWLIWTVVGWIDSWVWPFVPRGYQPEELVNWVNQMIRGPEAERISVNVRGIGVFVFLTFTVFVGWLGKGLIGRSFLRWGEGIVERMPVVRSIYSGVKQIAETVFSQRDTSFDKACLIEYPRKGIWAIAFISINAKGEIRTKIHGDKEIVTVFLPTTPNPTSGFLLFLPRDEVIELDMTVEDAAKLVISAGLVYPNGKDPTTPPAVL
ncbi:MAG: hypothetical protein COB65_05380 [Thalassobium sp.]|uniref:DUF502 domain-containing protein n=1 Tax=Octadecabacter sp. SW4 TaxID=2602067 RepID=UPI000C0F3364|nr:DUF502 domain-containing protein [Octadecabacter sp. SW4]PHQ84497.1 MAG: hypothetical protein COB65_05380 [Thalassobium sp.]QEE35564.1 DUF502 domain-containing protein [Octadecabacter sp. SW4]